MGKYKSILARGLGASSAAVMLAGKALAQEFSDSGASDAAAVGIFAGIWIFVIIAAIIGLVTLIFWIFMLIDAFKRTNWKDDSQKTTWLVVLIVSFVVGLHFIGALVYYFAVYRALGKASSAPVNK
ncbi:MAG: hypothetical protein Q8P54_02115 [bacterium]|nr:hypothetical protein [bacterium]